MQLLAQVLTPAEVPAWILWAEGLFHRQLSWRGSLALHKGCAACAQALSSRRPQRILDVALAGPRRVKFVTSLLPPPLDGPSADAVSAVRL